jgi:hypothetical protein
VKRLCFVAALVLAITALARSTRAHDPFELTAVARPNIEKLVIEVTMARSTARRLATGDRSARATFVPVEFAAYQSKLRALAPSLYDVTSDGRPLPLEAVSTRLTAESDVEIVVVSSSPPGATLRFRARHLDVLGEGYTSALSVERGGGKQTYYKLLTVADPVVEHGFELAKTDFVAEYAPLLALVGVLVLGRLIERLTRRGPDAAPSVE